MAFDENHLTLTILSDFHVRDRPLRAGVLEKRRPVKTLFGDFAHRASRSLPGSWEKARGRLEAIGNHFVTPGADNLVLRSAARRIRNSTAKAGYFALLGDFSDDGEEKSLAICRQLLFDDHDSTGFQVPVAKSFLVPGNHDRYRGRLCQPGGVRFDHTFGVHWSGGLGGVRSSAVYDSNRVPQIIFTAVDFCLSKHDSIPGNFGKGSVDRAINPLAAELERLRKDHADIPVVLLSHFPPVKASNSDLQLMGYERVIGLAKQNDVQLVFAGHTHKPDVEVVDGVTVFTAGSISKRGEKHGNHFHSIELTWKGSQLTSCIANTFSVQLGRAGAGFQLDGTLDVISARQSERDQENVVSIDGSISPKR